MISTRPNPFFALPPTLFFLQLVAAQVELAADLQKEVDANRPTCDALLEDAYDTFTESGQSGLAKKLYSVGCFNAAARSHALYLSRAPPARSSSGLSDVTLGRVCLV